MAVVGPGTVVGSSLVVVSDRLPGVHWAADLSQADCVAAGFKNDSFQRQNNAGTFNDNTVPWPVPTGAATSPRPGRSLTFSIPSGYRRYEVVPNHAAQEAGDTQFYGIAVRFPTGFPFSFGDFQLFEQLHQASGSGSPPVAFEARSNGIRLTGGFGLITPGSATGAHDQQLVASPALNTWHSLVYRVSNFSTSANVSTIDVWWNGTQVLANFTLPCPTLKTDPDSGETGTYRKNGIYRSQDNTTALTIELAGHATGTSYAEVDPSPTFVAPTAADALQNRVLTELRNWKAWLTANGARGMVGEWGVPTRYGQIGNTAEQAQWDALIEAYQDDLDAQGISGMMWASGREWFPEYTLAIHQGASRGAVLSVARQSVDNIVAAHPTRGAGAGAVWRGVGLSGHETGVSTSGGTAARTGTGFLHTAADFTYLASRGVDTVRIALGWERLQSTLSAALDTTALAALDVMVSGAAAVGIRVILDLHNYGRYTLADGSVYALGGNLTNAMFSDFWTRMSTWVRADATRSATVVGYGLMNEPHDLVGGAGTWETSSQAVVTAIRGGGDTRLIFVGGYSWSSLTDWVTTHADGWITDSAANYCYEAHHYFDTQSVLGSRSGTYQATLAGGDGAMLTYAAELASADPFGGPVASGNGRPGRRNLLPNPALAVDATGWTTTVTSGAGTASRVAVTGMDEPWAYQYAQTAAGTMYLESPRVAATPGLAYSGTVQCRYTAVPDSALIAITFYNASGTAVGTSAFDFAVTANTPKRLSATRVAPATAATCAVRVYLFTGSPAAATTVVATAARIEQSDDPNLAYADGDTSGWSWLGASGASPSRNPAALETARVNAVTNPYVVADLTGWVRWSYSGASTPTVTRTSVTGMDRPWAHRLTATGAHAFAVVAPKVAVTPGQGYSFTAQARFSLIPDVYAGIVLIYLKSDSTYLSEVGANERASMTAGVAYRSGLQQVVAPALAAFACIGFKWTTTTSTPTVDVTAARGELGLDASLSYADGGTAGWVWDGAVGTSTSRSVPTAPVLPNYAASTESAFPLDGRAHRRTVGIATTELDSARAVGLLRGGALVGTLADTFEAGALDPQWTAQ